MSFTTRQEIRAVVQLTLQQADIHDLNLKLGLSGVKWSDSREINQDCYCRFCCDWKFKHKLWTGPSTCCQRLVCNLTTCIMYPQVGIITTKNKRAEKLTDLAGEDHTAN